MTRDELLLAALAEGDTTTAALMRSTGMTERTCRYGISHLIAVGCVWSPERGRWRLTEAGRAIAWTLPSLSAADQADAEPIALPVGDDRTVTAAEATQPASAAEVPAGTSASFWWMLAGIAAAVVLTLARRSASSPPPAPPSAPPVVWAYDGWRI